VRSNGHLARVRRCFQCIAASKDGQRCEGKNEAHHVRLDGNGGTGLKPGDDRVIPLCGYHHRKLHDIGQRTFSVYYGVDFEQTIAALNRQSPHLRKLENGRS
jgi:hypothetical protein